jgi:2-dehydro-3-deoxygluconokinase
MDIVDRVGGGDAFTGAFLYAYLAFDKDIKKALQYGNASCALKHSIPGDVSWCTRNEVEELIRRGPDGGTNLRISR